MQPLSAESSDGGMNNSRGGGASRRSRRCRRYLGVGDLGGLLRQAAALRRDQVVVLGADVLVGVVQAAGTGPGRRPEEEKRTFRPYSRSFTSSRALNRSFLRFYGP